MSQAKLYQLPEFTFRRQNNGGILIEDASMESLRLGLLPSHFLIHVEYRNDISSDINIEVIHKKKVTEMMTFFQPNRNTILKYFCKNEKDFESYVTEQKQFIVAQRNEKKRNKNYVSEVCEVCEVWPSLYRFFNCKNVYRRHLLLKSTRRVRLHCRHSLNSLEMYRILLK